MPPRGFGPAAPAPLRTTCPKVTPPRGEQTLGRAAAGRRERSGGRREAEAARSSRSPAATRRAGCAPLPPLPPPPSLPLPPDDFQFTCRQPGPAALPGTAVTASAPSPPRGGSRAGPLVPPGDLGQPPAQGPLGYQTPPRPPVPEAAACGCR